MGGGRGVGRRGEERGGEGERTSGEWEKVGRIRAEGERRGREEVESGEQLHTRFHTLLAVILVQLVHCLLTFVSDHQSPAKNPPFG